MGDLSTAAEPLASSLARGAAAGLAGTVVMTAFQTYVEMPITGRRESDAPASLVRKLFGVRPKTRQGRRRLNYATHYAIGAGWGVAFGLAQRAGLRGQSAVAVVFPVLYAGDVVLNAALGLYAPARWSLQDWTIDIVDKLVQAEASAVALDRFGGGGGGA